ncbi:hypothetical protein D3C85_1246050 [compost metagenome]
MKPSVVAAIALVAASLTTSVAAEEWNAFSSSTKTAYLADVGGIGVLGDDTTIRIARVPTEGAAGDYSHKIEEFVLRCGAQKFRSILEVEYGPDGAEIARYDDAEAPWDDIPANGLGSYIKTIACDSQRASGSSPSIQAFIDSGRGK